MDKTLELEGNSGMGHWGDTIHSTDETLNISKQECTKLSESSDLKLGDELSAEFKQFLKMMLCQTFEVPKKNEEKQNQEKSNHILDDYYKNKLRSLTITEHQTTLKVNELEKNERKLKSEIKEKDGIITDIRKRLEEVRNEFVYYKNVWKGKVKAIRHREYTTYEHLKRLLKNSEEDRVALLNKMNQMQNYITYLEEQKWNVPLGFTVPEYLVQKPLPESDDESIAKSPGKGLYSILEVSETSSTVSPRSSISEIQEGPYGVGVACSIESIPTVNVFAQRFNSETTLEINKENIFGGQISSNFDIESGSDYETEYLTNVTNDTANTSTYVPDKGASFSIDIDM